MNCIRELGIVENNEIEVNSSKKVVDTIYIEADEDHIAMQNGKNKEIKLVYVHEGKKEVGKERYELINTRYFTGNYSNSEQLWLEVADYLDKTYDMEQVKTIYLSGDGARWIKEGLNWIKGSEYVLDYFHLSKYVKKATAHMPHVEAVLWGYINKLDKKSVKDLFEVIIDETESITITINITAFYLYREQTTLRYIFFDDNSIIERPFDNNKEFHYPYLLYIPPNCNSETYLIVRPNDANRKEYYYSDDLRDAKMMLKKWVTISSKYGVKCPVLVPIFPRPDEPEVNALSDEDKYEAFYVRNKEFYDKQESEDHKYQLLRMTDDAREYLLARGINTPKDKLVVSGATRWILGHFNLLRSFAINCQPDIKIEYVYDNPQSYSKFAIYVYNTMHKRR